LKSLKVEGAVAAIIQIDYELQLQKRILVFFTNECVSMNAPEDFKGLVEYIKKETKTLSSGKVPISPSKKELYTMPTSKLMACHEKSDD